MTEEARDDHVDDVTDTLRGYLAGDPAEVMSREHVRRVLAHIEHTKEARDSHQRICMKVMSERDALRAELAAAISQLQAVIGYRPDTVDIGIADIAKQLAAELKGETP